MRQLLRKYKLKSLKSFVICWRCWIYSWKSVSFLFSSTVLRLILCGVIANRNFFSVIIMKIFCFLYLSWEGFYYVRLNIIIWAVLYQSNIISKVTNIYLIGNLQSQKKIWDKLQFSCETTHHRKSLIPIFKNFLASTGKTFILGDRLRTRL